MSEILARIGEAIRVRQCGARTEIAYRHWIKRFLAFHRPRRPGEFGAREVELFLLHLAVVERCSTATQTAARNALLFLYREVLGKPFPPAGGAEDGR